MRSRRGASPKPAFVQESELLQSAQDKAAGGAAASSTQHKCMQANSRQTVKQTPSPNPACLHTAEGQPGVGTFVPALPARSGCTQQRGNLVATYVVPALSARSGLSGCHSGQSLRPSPSTVCTSDSEADQLRTGAHQQTTIHPVSGLDSGNKAMRATCMRNLHPALHYDVSQAVTACSDCPDITGAPQHHWKQALCVVMIGSYVQRYKVHMHAHGVHTVSQSLD
jgi:hypothetical protein